MRTQLIATLSALCLLPPAASADSMRCGKWVVDETASSAEILQKCGEPQQKDVREEDLYVPNANGRGTRKIGVQIVELWTYKRSTTLPMQVTVIDGKVVKLARLE